MMMLFYVVICIVAAWVALWLVLSLLCTTLMMATYAMHRWQYRKSNAP